MRTASFRRTTAVLLFVLAAVLASPPASSAAPRNEISDVAGAASLSPWELFDRLWSFLRAAWSKDSCSINPDGRCKPSPPTVAAKEGCHVDPDGRCKP